MTRRVRAPGSTAAREQRRGRGRARGVGGPVHESRPGRAGHAAVGRGGRPRVARERAAAIDLARSRAFDWTNAFALPDARVGRHPLPTPARCPACSSCSRSSLWIAGARGVAPHRASARRRASGGDGMTARRRRPRARSAAARRSSSSWSSRSSAGHRGRARARTARRRARRRPSTPPQRPRPGALSTAWYCPGLPASFPNRDQTLTLSNLGADRRRRGRHRASRRRCRPDRAHASRCRRDTVRTFDRATLDPCRGADRPHDRRAGTPLPPGPIVVEPFSPDVVVAGRASRPTTRSTVVPCATTASTDWYFAAGTTVRGVSQWLVLDNPFSTDARVDVTLRTDAGCSCCPALQGIDVPGRSRVVDPDPRAGGAPGARRGRGARRASGRSSPRRRCSSARASGTTGRRDDARRARAGERWWFTDGEAFAGASQWVALTDLGPLDAQVDRAGAASARRRSCSPVSVDGARRRRELGADRRLRARRRRLPRRSRRTPATSSWSVRRAGADRGADAQPLRRRRHRARRDDVDGLDRSRAAAG